MILETIKVKVFNVFQYKVIFLYVECFPKQKMKITEKDIWNPWITRGVNKSSKLKVRLYLKSLKIRINKNVFQYRNYGKQFEMIKKLAKTNCFWSVIFNYKSNVKKTLICNEGCIRENGT